MRQLTLSFGLVLIATLTQAQDPGTMAIDQAQQAAQLSQQGSQQAIQDMQQQSIQNTQQVQAQAQDASNLQCCYAYASKFSVKPGTYSRELKVKVTGGGRGTVIYYTTDGWTPTSA